MVKIKDVTILEIEGMSDATCVDKVTAALRGLPGVRTESVTIGTATIDCDNKVTFHSACKAVGGAGYKIRRAAAPVRSHEAPGALPATPAPLRPVATSGEL